MSTRLRGAAFLLLASSFVVDLTAQQDVPSELQAAIITRMLGYDRALKGRVGSSLTIGIVIKGGDRTAAKMQSELQQAFAAQGSVQGVPVSAKGHAYTSAAAFAEWITGQAIDVLYVAPGLDKELEAIRAGCAEHHVVGVSPVRAYVKQGLAVGVVAKGESPGLLVNLAVAKGTGMDMDPKLLSLAEVLR
jgi:uncharacterized protein DUF4154